MLGKAKELFSWEKHGNSSDELRIGKAWKSRGIAYHRDEMTSPGMARVSNDLKPQRSSDDRIGNGMDLRRNAFEWR